MAESKDFSPGTDSKSSSSATASVTPSRGAEGRRGSASSTKSSPPAKSRGSVERKKRKQRKAPATDQAGNEANVQPPQTADDKPTAEPPAGVNPQEDGHQEAPAAASFGLTPDATFDSVLHPMAPTSLPSGSTRVAMSDTSLSKTPATEPLDTNQEVTCGLMVPCVPQTEPPIPPRAATPEVILQKPSTSETLVKQSDDEHQVIPQLPPVQSELVQVPKVPEWSLQRPSKRVFRAGQKYAKGSMAICCNVLLLVAAVLVVVAFAKYFSGLEDPPKEVLCATKDCTAFGLELSAAIDTAADPCHDFHRFVCGGWEDPKRRETTEGRMAAAAAYLAIAEMETDGGRTSKATQFFHSCNTASAQREDNLREFAELRRSLGLSWPEQKPNGSVHPLDVMVDLAINWEMNFLFDLSAVSVRESTALLFSRGRLDAGWEQSAHYSWVHYEYEDYARKYYDILGVSDGQVDIESANLLKLEKAILNAKVAFLYDAPRQSWFKLSDLDSHTKTASAALWLGFLTKHDKQFTWTADSAVITEDVKIFRSIDKLMKDFDNDQLIIGLSWMFIQTHLWAVYGEPSIRFHGTPDALSAVRRRGCMEYVDSRLGLLSLSQTISEHYGFSENRLHVISFLYRLKQNVKRLVNNLTWMDEDSKRMAYRKLERMTSVLMPDDSFFERGKRDKLYSVFPNMAGNTFVTNIVKASEIYRGLRNHEHFADVYSVRVHPRYGRETYLYLPNLMKLAVLNLHPPLFFQNATFAIIYGGLGSFVARQMAKSLDDVGVTVDDAGQSGIWLSPNAAAVHAEKVACNVRASSYGGEWRPMRLFPAVAGLEIAYRSYMAAVAADYRALGVFRVHHLEAFTDDQVFFLTYCYALCSKRPQTMGDECNVPLKNSKRFAAAFRCPENSRMNPRVKCTFFDP
ncbi:neprilysin-2-like isoform X1 [Dermacentor albipictus]|uniref:neprilysin-2-like isoform X1 n=1 Tax=Dermacentor albipictus TaxID=60249 RepID=UPI0031FD08AA